MFDSLSQAEKRTLLDLARQTIDRAASRQPLPEIRLQDYTPNLQAPGASFVTLTHAGALRGCIGALEAYQPLVQDVCEHAAAAAMDDYRFEPLRPDEVNSIQIEISRLTAPIPLQYETPQDLLTLLRPGVDGVILRDGARRATFLPQVWEKLPEASEFLAHLCQKMGASPHEWKKKHLAVETYHVDEFHE